MRFLGYAVANVFETLLRLLPFPCRTGLIKIGKPQKDSPVFLTCNYHLTVQRVKRALKGMDAYLLIANSRGINVWCAAAGGHLTNHEVISVLKTSGIEGLVGHRQVILPQLAATGVELKIIKEKTGWRIIWGPVYAKDIPVFMQNKMKAGRMEREVKFPFIQRLEVAISWAFSLSLLAGIIAAIFFPRVFVPLILFIWGLSLATFIFYPLYGSWLSSGKGSLTFSLLVWGVILLALVLYSHLSSGISWRFLIRWGIISFVFVFITTLDLKGGSPLLAGGFEELKVTIDEDKCRGAAFCETVCPRNCYDVNRKKHKAILPRAERCVLCGACIIQCPFDALYFKNPEGEVILPGTMRKYKQNLLGKRVMKTGNNR
ncbi:MAG: 4Fe-4S dicluster domain-containing protein [Candidatus Aminicenantes bacterium]|nr:4Fe-4S dicluster domain-containing protein [Candidatus Aminicenantes bacterium]